MKDDELSVRGSLVKKSHQPLNERAETLTNRAQSLLLSSLHRTDPSWLAYQQRHNLRLGIDFTPAQNELPSRGYNSGRPRAASEFRTEDYDNDRINVNNIGILEYRHLVADLLVQQMAQYRDIPYAQLPFETREMVGEQVSPVVLPTDEEIQTMIDAACQYGYRDPQIDDYPDRLTTYENPKRNRLRTISHIHKVCISGNFTSFQELLDLYTNRLVGMAIAIKNNDGQALLHQLASVAGVLRLQDVGLISDEIIKQWQTENTKTLTAQAKLKEQIATATPLQSPPQLDIPTASPVPQPTTSLTTPMPIIQPGKVPSFSLTIAPATNPISANVIATSATPALRRESAANSFVYDSRRPLLEQVATQIERTGQVDFSGDQRVMSAILGSFLGTNGEIQTSIDQNTINIVGNGIRITKGPITITINIKGQLVNKGIRDLCFRELRITVVDAPRLLKNKAIDQAAQEQERYASPDFSLNRTLLQRLNEQLLQSHGNVSITDLTLNIENGQLHIVIRGKRKQ